MNHHVCLRKNPTILMETYHCHHSQGDKEVIITRNLISLICEILNSEHNMPNSQYFFNMFLLLVFAKRKKI